VGGKVPKNAGNGLTNEETMKKEINKSIFITLCI
jgi:hypothetical protein